MILKIQRLQEAAILPTRAHEYDAGLDLYALDNAFIYAGTRQTVRTGIAVAVPAGHVGLVFPRSGNAFKRGLSLTNAVGVIDHGYTGEIQANIINHDHDRRVINYGERIAQLVIVPIPTITVVEVDELDETERGTGGFGSSGA